VTKLSDTAPSVAAMNDMEPTTPVVVDCDSCLVRCPAVCGDCVVSVLLGPPSDVAFDADERAALDTLAASGLVPPLRLVVSLPDPQPHRDAG
jgi:hypothetical protein